MMPESASTALSRPLGESPVDTIELRTRTRAEEARTALGVVSALTDRGVSLSEILIVVRDLDTYESDLTHAADRVGVSVDYWTQLRVSQTRLFQLIEGVCHVFGSSNIGRDELLRPLSLYWVPITRGRGGWPVEQHTVEQYRDVLPDERHTPTEWVGVVDDLDVDDRLETFIDWVVEAPHPNPATVASILGRLIDAYEETVLPVITDTDRPDRTHTEREAQAVTRLRTLVEGQLEHKFEDRLDEGVFDETWGSVAELCRLIVTQRPGRREHSNARVVDVVESNDVWGKTTSYVIAVGLVDGIWPQPMGSPLPAPFQQLVLDGDEVEQLAPRVSWTDGRDRDHFSETLHAASEAVILTRHTEGYDGGEKHPSPYLEWIDPVCSVGVDPSTGIPKRVLDVCLSDGEGGGVDGGGTLSHPQRGDTDE